MKLIDGTAIAKEIEQKIQKEISELTGRKPGLAFIRVGENPGSKVYINLKKKKCQEVGIISFDYELKETATQEDLIALIENLNKDSSIDGVLLQLPLPPHLSPLPLIEKIDPKKDVDGFHPYNIGRLLLGNQEGPIPCTPKGIHTLLVKSSIEVSGKHTVIVGRSNIVGKPLAALLMQKEPTCNATVTIAHGGTKNLEALCKEADILVCAMGSPCFITDKHVKQGAVVIDVGMNKIQKDGKSILVGDVDFEKVSPICSHITPVPKGVGPMTIAELLSNTLASYKKRI